MILTKKGSTRGTVSVLLLATAVIFGARVIVSAIEGAMPDSVRTQVVWKPVVESTRKNEKRMFVENKDDRPVLLFFTDRGSTICRDMEERVLCLDFIRQLIEKHFYPVKISFDKVLSKSEYELYQKYGSAGVPEMIIVYYDGMRLTSGNGYLSAAKVCVLLNDGLKRVVKEEMARKEAEKERQADAKKKAAEGK
jgi:thioredoxin-related protein